MTRSRDKEASPNGGQNPRFHIEIDSGVLGTSLLVNGVVGVCELSAERIRLITKRGSLVLLGRRLSVSSLVSGTLEINGALSAVQIGVRQKGESDGDKT